MLLASAVFANELYVQQIGDNLDLDVLQDGTDNIAGTAEQSLILNGDDMTLDIDQVGDNNVLAVQINGNTYTGTIDITGNANNVDLVCDSPAAGNCENVTVDITVNGDTSDIDLRIGETADASNLVATFTVDGDANVIDAEFDGVNADATVVIDNSASLAGGNTVNIDVDGDGDINGHSLNLGITGGGGVYNITQSGINDNTVDATFEGDNATVDIIQSD
jgi:hypothetical protein